MKLGAQEELQKKQNNKNQLVQNKGQKPES